MERKSRSRGAFEPRAKYEQLPAEAWDGEIFLVTGTAITTAKSLETQSKRGEQPVFEQAQ